MGGKGVVAVFTEWQDIKHFCSQSPSNLSELERFAKMFKVQMFDREIYQKIFNCNCITRIDPGGEYLDNQQIMFFFV